MSVPRRLEADLLSVAEAELSRLCRAFPNSVFEARLQLLEACASRFGGFDLATYLKAFKIKPLRKPAELFEMAGSVASQIEKTPIHPALALSSLARQTLKEVKRRSTGAYHTDFRLAKRLAALAAPHLTYRSKVIDPACGAGILLVALTIAVCGRDRAKTSVWLANGVYAADLSASSLRGALLALASLTDDVRALCKMRARWFCGDSLLAEPAVWKSMAPSGFDAVIGNPPWEKIKLSRHEFLRSSGSKRHYGAETKNLDEARFNSRRKKVATYSKRLLVRYPDLGCGEPDLYIAFTEMFFELCRPGGAVAAIVPGGLIRSQGTEVVRRRLFNASQTISISVIDNRARFFEIDTRFKFLAIALVKLGKRGIKRDPIKLLHERGSRDGLRTHGSAVIGRANMEAIRDDLSIPEVRSSAEWKLFHRMSKAGSSWNDPKSGWRAYFCREVDMSKERSRFLPKSTPSALPVVEGRMVHQHRFGVKAYADGSGRRAIWRALPIGASKLCPQFWIESEHIPPASLRRINVLRAGFCDITGQTNERSLLAALIPPGVICGNKVPTILFPDDPSEDRLLAWVAVANSIPFDWMLRRVLTTTVNYFLLQSVPMPKLAKDGLPWKKLVSSARELRRFDTAGTSLALLNRTAQLRAEIDAEVAVAYGLGMEDLELMLHDFPILDRGQPPLPGEEKSTITCDTLLAAAAKRFGRQVAPWSERASQARSLGAVAYVPSEIVGDAELFQESGNAATI